MRKREVLETVRGLLPPETHWPSDQGDVQLQDGTTVLMLVARMPDFRLALKLIDCVYHFTVNFWARDSHGRHVIMDACYYGVHPSVLQRLMKWARKCTLNVIVPMSRLDVDGLDAMELAIREGHGELASCLLGTRDAASYYDSFCNHYPLEVLELAIQSRNEHCVRAILTNKRVLRGLQPGATTSINVTMRWMQRQNSNKRLFNIFTCVGAAVRCNMPQIVQLLQTINPEETRQAVWYAVSTLPPESAAELSPELQQMANSYLFDKIWPQIGVIILLRSWEQLARTGNEHAHSLWQRTRHLWRHENHDWETIASHPWTTLPNDLFAQILSFLLPSKTSEMRKVASLVRF
ncbi:hypothetical protein L917_18954 [Phytophthora nicotianae]|uniref:F-box domain-containing protein n=1 Tax=Phytophthora nicotianae TaxID=4792 RepID=W2K5W0_PHYNI|nr:hypothetical protein L917_18954 [Phytophthora nicotianae]